MSTVNMIKVMVMAVIIGIVGIIFCQALHACGKFAKRIIENEFIRILVGGLIIVGLTFALQTFKYNGAGMDGVNLAMTGVARPWDFAIKMLFTVITLSFGYKGGEIVPTLFIGSTLGVTLAGIFGISPVVGAMLGMVCLFCCVTNSPLASIFLAIEGFGSGNLIAFVLVIAVGFVVSGNSSLYTRQGIVYSKIASKIVNRRAH